MLSQVDKSLTLDVKAAMEEYGYTELGLKSLLRTGKVEAEKVPVKEGSRNLKWLVNRASLEDHIANRKHGGRGGGRSDGRTKYNLYLTEEERTQVMKELAIAGLEEVANLVRRANPPKTQ